MPERRPTISWRLAAMAMGGLLVALVAVGVVGIVVNRGVTGIVEQAIRYDVELEDNADDLRVAILDVRHYHRDLLFNDPAPRRVDAWHLRYQEMLAEIDELEALYGSGLRTDDLPPTALLRDLALAYYADFRPEIEAYDPVRPVAFQLAADANLWRLERLEVLAEQLDKAGEERAAVAFSAVDGAVNTGTLVLIGVIAGLGLVGLALAAAVFAIMGQQRRLIAAEQAAAAREAEASRAKTDFIADASHELRTPLTVLRGNAEIGLALESGCEHAEGTRAALHEIVAESARLSVLVDDLLFLARTEAAGVPLDVQHLDAGELLRTVSGRGAVLARERGATLRSRIELSGSLSADPARIEQAVLILVDNAAKYGPTGGVVELTAWREAGTVVIDVADQGPGIPESDLGRIFERFYRAAPGRRLRRATGAGLGLPIARAIVTGHGGDISASGRPGNGTVMTIRLPSGAAPEAAAEPAGHVGPLDAAPLGGEAG